MPLLPPPMIQSQFIRSVELLPDAIRHPEEYPYSLPAVRHLHRLEFHPQVTFIVGENGSGKSTILEALAVCYGLNAEGGSKNFDFSTQQTHSSLHEHIRIAKGTAHPKDAYFLRAESYYNLASTIDALDSEPSTAPLIRSSYGGTSLHEQSHGESFFALFTERLGGNGMYIFDEPEAALSPQRQMELLVRLHELVEQRSQFIIATHSPILLTYPQSIIYTLSEEGYRQAHYQDTDHFTLYKMFLDHPDAMLEKLNIPTIPK